MSGGAVELTCMLIKPDGVAGGYVGAIVDRIEQEGFVLRGVRLLRLTRGQAEAFYAVHRERAFFGELVEYMTGGPILAMALERQNAVSWLRQVIGATDPAGAAEGTIRALYGRDVGTNTVHGSDSVENGIRETLFFFAESELAQSGASIQAS